MDEQSKASTAEFQFSGILKRLDFNIGQKFPVKMISDEVKIKQIVSLLNGKHV